MSPNTLLTRCEQRAVRYFTMRTHNLSTLPCNENRTPLLAVRYLGRDTLLRLFPFQIREQAIGGIFKEVNDVVEIFGTTVIRVGDGGGIVVGEEIGHEEQAGGGWCGGSAALELAHIVVVHADDVVKAREVGFPNGARAMGEAITATGGVATHTRVGEFAFVVVDEACRINVEGFGQAALVY